MKKSKLINLLSTFTPSELGDFQKTHILPQQNTKIIHFFNLLYQNYPEFEERKIQKQQLYFQIFNTNEYKDIKIRELMSQLYRLVCDFLSIKELQEKEFYQELYLLRQFRKRNVSKQFDALYKKMKSSLKKDNYKNTEHNKRVFLLEKEAFQAFDEKQKREHEFYLQSKVDHFDQYYFSLKLRESCEMIARQKVLNQKYNINQIEPLLEIIRKDSKLNSLPSIQVYSAIFNLLNSEEDTFDNCFIIIKKQQQHFSKEEQQYIYNNLLNYCILEVNNGRNHYTRKLFLIQKLLLQTKLFFQKNTFSHISYRNVVPIAIKLKEFDWAVQYIEEYKNYVLPIYRENAYNLSKANILYAQQNYNETIVLLNQIEFTDSFYAASAKYLLCKAYYLLKEYETLDYSITAFQLFLKRNKEIPAPSKKASDNFLKILKGLVQISKKLDYWEDEKIQHKIALLEKKIKDLKTIANKTWLIGQLEKLQ